MASKDKTASVKNTRSGAELHGDTMASGAKTAGDSLHTRQKVIDAAIACIMEKGYYKSSSNEVARWAGLSWGVIQYHFGTRENLMLAVLDDANKRLIDHMRELQIDALTSRSRIQQLFESLVSFYGRAEYLAILEIHLNLIRDPRTSERVRQEGEIVVEKLKPVYLAVPMDVKNLSMIVDSLRGIIFSHLLRADSHLTMLVDAEEDFEERSATLMDALAAYLDSQLPE